VEKASFSEPDAANYVAATIIERREKVLRKWLTVVNPLTGPAIGPGGVLTFEDASAAAGITSGARYHVSWRHFDNALGEGDAIGPGVEVLTPRAEAPLRQLAGRDFVAVSSTSDARGPPGARQDSTVTSVPKPNAES
jgi:hypothetical protein